MKTIIAFCGLAGSGKDTAANYLVEEHGFKKASFAAPLKQMVKIAFGFSDEQLYGPSSKREEQDERYAFSGTCLRCGHTCWIQQTADYHPEVGHTTATSYRCPNCTAEYPVFINARIALQTLGTEWGRRLSPDIWAKAAINQILSSDHELWCISDLRFKNEFDAVNAVNFRSEQPTHGYTVRLLRGELKHAHASETELISIPLTRFHKVIDNQGSLDELYDALDDMIFHPTRSR